MNAKPDIQPVEAVEAERRRFTLEEANRALPYVSRVTEDIRHSYRRAVALQEQLDQPVPDDDIDLLRDEYEQTIGRLNRYVDELHDVGVELKDYEVGLVDFPSTHEGREIFLCWKSGEDHIEAWHEVHAGFAGRQKVSELIRPTASNRRKR
jgi:hypothetical protein